MEEALIEVPTMRRFAGIELISRIPDETAILAFRHLLEKQELGELIFETVKAQGLLEVCAGRPGWGVAPTVLCGGTAPDSWPPSPPPRLPLQAI